MYEGETKCLKDIHVVRNIRTDGVLVEPEIAKAVHRNFRRTKRRQNELGKCGCPNDGTGRKEFGGCYPLGVNMNSNKCAIGCDSALVK